jgi:hypothetical protein
VPFLDLGFALLPLLLAVAAFSRALPFHSSFRGVSSIFLGVGSPGFSFSIFGNLLAALRDPLGHAGNDLIPLRPHLISFAALFSARSWVRFLLFGRSSIGVASSSELPFRGFLGL